MRQVRRTYCRNCPAACGLNVAVEAGRVIEVSGDRDHPLSGGYLCTKGLMSAEWHSGHDRLRESLLLREDGDGHRSVAVAEALDEVARRVKDILAAHGPRSVALYFGTGVKMNTLGPPALKAWLEAVGSPYLYSSSTIDQSAKWVTAGRLGVFTTGKPAVTEVETMLLVGSNPPVSHAGLPNKPLPTNNPQKWVREARRRGAKLIVVDPRKTEIARYADLHVQVFPGEDVAFLAGVLHVILANGWEDKTFCARYVASLDRLRDAVAPFTPDYAAARARVPVSDVVECARFFALARKKSASSGTGPNMSPESNTAEHLLESLNAVCGAYRRAGDKIANAGAFRPRAAPREGVVAPRRTWEQEPKLWTQDSGMVGGEFPTSRLPDEILEGGVRALIVVGGNPANALGQPDKTLAAFRNLDLLVTIDSRMTETARLSHVVIPTALPYERYDATEFLDTFFLETFAQLATPLTKPPPGVLQDWEVFWHLAHRMDLSLTLRKHAWGGPAGGTGLTLDPQVKPRSEDLIRWLFEGAAVSFEALAERPEGVVVDAAPLVVQPPGPDDGARLDVCPADVAAEIEAARRREPDPRYPYRLAVRRIVETMNSAFRMATRSQERWPTNPAFMNPHDMDRENLSDGDRIELVSEAGVLSCEVEADRGVRPGVISMSHQWGAPVDGARGAMRGAFTGRLVSLDRNLEAINFMPMQSGVPVAVRRPATMLHT